MSKFVSDSKKMNFRKVGIASLSVLLVLLLIASVTLTVTMFNAGYFKTADGSDNNSDLVNSVGVNATDKSPEDDPMTEDENNVDTTITTKGTVLIDEMNDTSKMYSNTPLYFDPANADLLGNDNGRASRPHDSLNSSIVYEVDSVKLQSDISFPVIRIICLQIILL